MLALVDVSLNIPAYLYSTSALIVSVKELRAILILISASRGRYGYCGWRRAARIMQLYSAVGVRLLTVQLTAVRTLSAP